MLFCHYNSKSVSFGIIFSLISIIPIIASLAVESAPNEHLEVTGRHQIHLIYEYRTVWPAGGTYTGVLKLPLPPNTGTQEITQLRSSLPGRTETDGNVPPHRILTIELTQGAHDDRALRWRIDLVGTFTTHCLVEGPPPATQPPIVTPGAGEFLSSTQSIDWESPDFQSWLDGAGLRRPAGETAVGYGARLYHYCTSHGRYEYPPWGGWSASGACERLRTDCGGFSLVFVAACRANHIPARLLVGQWFKTQENADGTLEMTGRQAHVIAEFFDPQIGWVPEDISSTLLKVEGAPDYNYFGREPGYFFAWHFDTDFHFAVPTKADAFVQWIQNPAPWFSANAQDASDDSSHRWVFEGLK